jgi:hypothetical protein
MKTKLISMTTILIFLLFGCEKEESTQKINIDISSISFTDCNTDTKSTDNNAPSIRLIGQANGILTVKMLNTEFCCGTDSVSIGTTIDENKLSFEIIDNGSFSYCYCPHDLEFNIISLGNKEYELTLIESENSYSRDTFLIQFDYSEQLDTTILNFNTQSSCDQNVIISETEYQNAPNDPFSITEMTITGDCLNIKFGASGCDGNTWIVKLIDLGVVAESYPCQRTLRLSLDNKEICTAVPTKEISFNIKDLQIYGDDKVILHISGEDIFYEY